MAPIGTPYWICILPIDLIVSMSWPVCMVEVGTRVHIKYITNLCIYSTDQHHITAYWTVRFRGLFALSLPRSPMFTAWMIWNHRYFAMRWTLGLPWSTPIGPWWWQQDKRFQISGLFASSNVVKHCLEVLFIDIETSRSKCIRILTNLFKSFMPHISITSKQRWRRKTCQSQWKFLETTRQRGIFAHSPGD